MSTPDWIILAITLTGIIAYGMYKSSATKNLEGYFLSNRDMPWYLVLLSIMGTQASAITFLSAPGQAYTDGMRFVQYYFGLPLAMVLICIFFVPVFLRLHLYTAYAFLEKRFDLKTRTLTAALFLISRGFSTGISIYAPAIILSSLMGWNIYFTNLVMGGLLIIYTVSGGAKAVAHTQTLQLAVIFAGMFLAGFMVVRMLPEGIGFSEALSMAGKEGKMNIITTGFTSTGTFDWKDKYNIWSGLIGGLFLALSYFGTDQSQVGRYLTAKSDRESKLGLLMNGLVKIPMQLLILLIGILVFTFYQYHRAPVFFDKARIAAAEKTEYRDSLRKVEAAYTAALSKKDLPACNELRHQYKSIIKAALPGDEANDTNFIFLRFVVDYLPRGLVGLLIAVIFLAAWGSIAAALNSLSACTIVDFHHPFLGKHSNAHKAYRAAQGYTIAWGIFSVGVAMFAHNLGNSLIEAVNILGSLFYGVILGIFLTAFYLKRVGGHAVFYAALLAEAAVIAVYMSDALSFLWLNVVGALLVMALSLVLQPLTGNGSSRPGGVVKN